MKLEAHACLGTGDDHAKWSPVATAYYRFHPEVTLQEPVRGPEAEELVKRCPMNVFDIEDSAGTPHATVARPRNCSMCRECVRPAEWDRKIKLARKQHHFICA